MTLKYQLTHPKAKAPYRATEHSAGFDLFAAEIVRYQGQDAWFSCGLRLEIPEGYMGLIFPRSSITKSDLILGNSVGVIDSDYRGDVQVRFKRIGNSISYYTVGDRIAQLIIVPYLSVSLVESDLSETERGTGGFGSSGA